MKNKKLVIANWKMNPTSAEEAKKLFLEINKISSKLKNTTVVVCAPFIYLNELKSRNVIIGAQDVFSKNKGSFTGMVSPLMLKNGGIEYTIIGHSERRFFGENDKIINEKVKSSLKSGLKIILCIGEDSRDENVKYFEFVRNQILKSLDGVSKNFLKNIFIVYEPVWAISNNSKNVAMSPENINEMAIFIKKVLADKFGLNSGVAGILYGGSVNPKNARSISEIENIDGLLVGKASLDAKKFGEILKIVDL